MKFSKRRRRQNARRARPLQTWTRLMERKHLFDLRTVCDVTYHNVWQRTVHLIATSGQILRPIQTALLTLFSRILILFRSLLFSIMLYFTVQYTPAPRRSSPSPKGLLTVICSYLCSCVITHCSGSWTCLPHKITLTQTWITTQFIYCPGKSHAQNVGAGKRPFNKAT
jgi:hypothetical protein